MKNDLFSRFFNYHVGSDDELQINFAWPYTELQGKMKRFFILLYHSCTWHLSNFLEDQVACHATDGPPRPSVLTQIAPRSSMAAIGSPLLQMLPQNNLIKSMLVPCCTQIKSFGIESRCCAMQLNVDNFPMLHNYI